MQAAAPLGELGGSRQDVLMPTRVTGPVRRRCQALGVALDAPSPQSADYPARLRQDPALNSSE